MIRKASVVTLLFFFLLAGAAQAAWTPLYTWGEGGWQPGELEMPGGVSISGSQIYIADMYNDRIGVYSLDGTYQKTIGGPVDLSFPYDVDVAPDGTIFVANTYKSKITRYSASGKFLRNYGSFGTGKGQFKLPGGVDVTQNYIWVADSGNGRVQVLNYKGKWIRSFRSGRTTWPFGISVYNSRVYLTANIALSSGSSHQAEVFTTEGKYVGSFGPYGYGNGKLSESRGIVANSSGIYIAAGSTVQRFSLDGTWQETLVSGIVPGPFGLDVTSSFAAVSSGDNKISVYQP